MEFFIELTGSEDYDIHHTKLIEYGIMTSIKSDHIKEKLENIGLVEGVDFILKEVNNPRLTGEASTTKDYYLNSDSFKFCLLTAQRRPGQEVDPFIYSDYYILLERIYILYTYYQRTYNAKLISIKDEKLEELSKKQKELSKKQKDLSKKQKELSKKHDELSKKRDELSKKRKELIARKANGN